MKKIIAFAVGSAFLFSCHSKQQPIVPAAFTDSLLSHYNAAAAISANEQDIAFWKKRIQPNTPDYTNTSRYAAALMARFQLLGDIADVQAADSVLLKQVKDFNGKEAASYLSLVPHAILQHQFVKADSLLSIAKNIGLKNYESFATSFDVDFELGRITLAELDLKNIKDLKDFGFQFRTSKMMHYTGNLDASISAMKEAAALGASVPVLQQSALSNLGDLYIHSGALQKAADCFTQCIKTNAADLHSLMGLGWIALVKDHNDSLAERIFRFVSTKTKSPEPLFKLIAVAQQRGDSVLELQYAKAFEQAVTGSRYGNMYNKYLIQLYTGILNAPAKAVAIAQRELYNRNTPQTNAWYAWSLAKNNEAAKAAAVYEEKVSGKPLEGLELYWMGKLMQQLNKGYNAKQFFEEAIKNKYDLSPAVVKDITTVL